MELASENEIELEIDFDHEMGKSSCESSVKKTTFKNYLSLKLLCLLCLKAHENVSAALNYFIKQSTKSAHINDYYRDLRLRAISSLKETPTEPLILMLVEREITGKLKKEAS